MTIDARFADALARLPDYLGSHVLASITALALGHPAYDAIVLIAPKRASDAGSSDALHAADRRHRCRNDARGKLTRLRRRRAARRGSDVDVGITSSAS